MRSKKALKNTITAIIGEIVTVICGFILPRLILSSFGSTYNGITSSITQFLSCVVLLRSGIGGVTRAALYKPLADNDNKKISAIINATQKFMTKVSIIFVIALVIFALVYPLFVKSDFDFLFSFSLVLILGISTLAQTYFGVTYQILLQADQKLYIYNIINIATTILNTIISSILILCGFGIHIVKLGAAFVFVLNPIVLNIYVSKKYKINKSVVPDNTAISQRWDAFFQNVAQFVNTNTDMIILTMFSTLREVSVYTVYMMVVNGLYKVENTFCNGISAAFGNMLAKKETETLKRNMNLFEMFVFTFASFLFITGGVLIVPFVKIYTLGVKDVDYVRYFFAILACINQFLYSVRLPYQMIVEAAGHFKQTRKAAIIEVSINIVLSIILVIKYGLIGVTIGTFCSILYRTIKYSIYASKNILNRSMYIIYKRIFVSFLETITVVLIVFIIPHFEIVNYLNWIIYAIIISIISLTVITIYSLIFFKEDFINLINKIKNILKRKKK